MIALIVFTACVLGALGAGCLAAWSDIRGMRIPNACAATVACLFVPAWLAVWFGGGSGLFASLPAHLLAGLAVFAATYALFALRVFGAGDAKLITAYAFWMGWAGLPPFAFYVAGFGAVLALATLGVGKWKSFAAPSAGGWIARAQAGEKVVPYGIAITAGAFAAFAKLGFFSPHTLSSLLR